MNRQERVTQRRDREEKEGVYIYIYIYIYIERERERESVPKNNSKANTHLVTIAEVKDTVKNLQTIFKELKNQIHALQNFARRQKRLLSSSLETMLPCPMEFQERQGHSVPVLS